MTELRSQMKRFEGQVQSAIARDFADLERARDEMARMIHLAGTEAETSWHELEKKFSLLRARANREGSRVADDTWALARELRQSLKDFKARVLSSRARRHSS